MLKKGWVGGGKLTCVEVHTQKMICRQKKLYTFYGLFPSFELLLQNFKTCLALYTMIACERVEGKSRKWCTHSEAKKQENIEVLQIAETIDKAPIFSVFLSSIDCEIHCLFFFVRKSWVLVQSSDSKINF